MNRATDDEIRDGNVSRNRSRTRCRSDAPPPVVVYSNSIQAGNGTVYGDAKAKAADIPLRLRPTLALSSWTCDFPNLFGEHGRPFYNAVTATFATSRRRGVASPRLTTTRSRRCCTPRTRRTFLIGTADLEDQGSPEVPRNRLRATGTALATPFARIYRTGEIPDIATAFDRDLFNTYRSYTFESQTPIRPLPAGRVDARGLFEIIRRRRLGPILLDNRARRDPG